MCIAIFILWFNYSNANERFVSRSYLYDDSFFVSCTFFPRMLLFEDRRGIRAVS